MIDTEYCKTNEEILKSIMSNLIDNNINLAHFRWLCFTYNSKDKEILKISNYFKKGEIPIILDTIFHSILNAGLDIKTVSIPGGGIVVE